MSMARVGRSRSRSSSPLSDPMLDYKKINNFGRDDFCQKKTGAEYQKGPCGQRSQLNCASCKEDPAKFYVKEMNSGTMNSYKKMHQCRATCAGTGKRCTRHVWEGDTGYINKKTNRPNEYGQPLWCLQHMNMCMKHQSWYKSVCDVNGLKQPHLRFMDNWLEHLNQKGRGNWDPLMRRPNYAIKEDIENLFWDQVHGQYHKGPIDYKDNNFRNLIQEYFVYLVECYRRRTTNDRVCFTHEYIQKHGSYVKAIRRLIDVMVQNMPRVRDGLVDKTNQLMNSSLRNPLNNKEPTENIEPSPTLNFSFNGQTANMTIPDFTSRELFDMSHYAPHLYSSIYQGLTYSNIDIQIPPITTGDAFKRQPDIQKFTWPRHSSGETDARKLLTTGKIPRNIKQSPESLFGLLHFMDFCGVLVNNDDSQFIMEVVRDIKRPADIVMMVYLSTVNDGQNSFILVNQNSFLRQALESTLNQMDTYDGGKYKAQVKDIHRFLAGGRNLRPVALVHLLKLKSDSPKENIGILKFIHEKYIR